MADRKLKANLEARPIMASFFFSSSKDVVVSACKEPKAAEFIERQNSPKFALQSPR